MSRISRTIGTVDQEVRHRTAKRCRERGIVIPTFKQMRDPSLLPAIGGGEAEGRRPLGRESREPLPDHLEERPRDGALRRPELPRDPPGDHRHQGARRRPRREVLPDGSPQGRRRLRLPRPAPRQRRVRPREAQGRLAVDRQLLPRRRVRLRGPGLHGRRDPPREHVPGALHVAPADRLGGHRDAGLREQREGDLRQVLGAEEGPGARDLQPVRGVRKPDLALQRDRPRGGRGLRRGPRAEVAPRGLGQRHRQRRDDRRGRLPQDEVPRR